MSLRAVSEHTTARPDDPGPAAGGSGRPGPPHPGPRPASSRGGPTQGPSSHPTPPKHLSAGQERPRGRRPLAESRRRHRPRAVCPAGSREARAHARRRGASSPQTSSRTARCHAGLRGRDGPKNGRRAWRRVCAMRLLANRVRRGGDKGSRTLDTGSRDALQGVTEDRQHPRASAGAFPGAAGLEERRRGSLRR